MRSSPNPGVPLAHYRQHRGGVTLTCLDCMDRRTFDLEAVIARLATRGVGGEQTGIKAVAGFVRGDCPRCAGRRFETRPHFPERPRDPASTRPSHAP